MAEGPKTFRVYPKERQKPRELPFGAMEVGEVVFSPFNPASLYRCTGHWRKKGRKFRIQLAQQDGVRGSRVERLQ